MSIYTYVATTKETEAVNLRDRFEDAWEGWWEEIEKGEVM